MPADKKKKDPILSFIAGTAGGAVEGAVTYPTEYVKTRLQLQAGGKLQPGEVRFKGPVDCFVQIVKTKGIGHIYTGVGALVIGNAAKAGVRFLTYDQIAGLLKDKDGKLTGVRSLLAGLGAGMTEAALVVTPSETIKTKLIHDKNLANPRFNGLLHGTMTILKEEGISGVYRGLGPVMAKQGANSAVRFSCYSTFKTQMQKWRGKGNEPLPAAHTFVVGGMAGIVTVYATMPFDVIKTRMQGLDARTLYKNSFDCVMQVVKKNGVFSLWKGTTPRLVRLVLAGGITFTVYEKVYQALEMIKGSS
ncbi:mitochondrial carrier domain-containing protein [Radiomyces spectabilis]|uniref:mitochondrial carrier domain-containing protein n=1 Tax=Radiomyces spectabilis TaxID=64574 RepID=UPI002220B83F|nr:mitochondrial carrier domain-containing protein [Radiomyces spectabilis]KAI8384885.1 mitochondrial carrier domain-containing protein [Radiomyces spectabilis]